MDTRRASLAFHTFADGSALEVVCPNGAHVDFIDIYGHKGPFDIGDYLPFDFFRGMNFYEDDGLAAALSGQKILLDVDPPVTVKLVPAVSA